MKRCGDRDCYAHDGETCARGYIDPRGCPAWLANERIGWRVLAAHALALPLIAYLGAL
jgi:hypothetical protein